MERRKTVVGVAVGLAVGLCAVIALRSGRDRLHQLVYAGDVEPVGFVEMLKDNVNGQISAESARFLAAGFEKGRGWAFEGKALSLGEEEANALLKILGDVTRFQKPEGAMCVLLQPMPDHLGLTVSENGRKAYYEFHLSVDRGLVGDQCFRTYVVPQQDVPQLQRLLPKASAASTPGALFRGQGNANAHPVGKETTDALLKITREVIRHGSQAEADEALLHPTVDTLTLQLDDGVSYEFGLSRDRRLLYDWTTHQTCVVPQEQVAQLERLLPGKNSGAGPGERR
jgi:hypothetical protein